MKIGFIGAGKVGFSLGKYFQTHNLRLSGYCSLNPCSAKEAAAFTGTLAFDSIEALCLDSDIIFITVPDSAIKPVFLSINQSFYKEKVFVHASGSLSAKECFEQASHAYSLHPMCAVSDKENSYQDFDRVTFTLEGTEDKFDSIREHFEKAGLKIVKISSENKVKYHLSSVFASNLVVGIYQRAKDLLTECGFTDEQAHEALSSLFLGNARNIVSSGTIGALTGPVQRADAVTVKKHILQLNKKGNCDDLELYLNLSKTILNIAAQKNPNTDFSELIELINRQAR